MIEAATRTASVSDTCDVIVIGAGAGGMTAAAVAAAEGLCGVVIEKTEFVGGTTAWSGGMIWIPVNAAMRQAGIDDSICDATPLARQIGTRLLIGTMPFAFLPDPLGCGDVPLAGIPSVLNEIGYLELPML